MNKSPELGLKVVGRTRPIHDARGKATGATVFTGDMVLPGMVHAKLLLSPVAHARIRSIDTSEAESVPGVVGVFTHRDVAGMRFSSARLTPEEEGCIEDEPLLAETVRFAGDRVAAVIAGDADTAAAAARLIRVDYEELPAAVDLKEIYRRAGFDGPAEAELLDEYDFDIATEEPPAEGSDSLPVVETCVHTPKTHHAAMENHVCLAACSADGELTLWTPCQGVFGVRTTVADLLGLSYSRVRVVKAPMGGSFGGKQEALLEPLTAFLAWKLRRPVKLQLDRRECMSSTMTRPATIIAIRSRVRPDGRLQESRIRSLLDAGAYAGSSAVYSRSLGAKIFRLYRVPRVVNHARAYHTHTPKAGGARGWGSPEFFTAMEIHMDQLAGRLGMDPVDLRLKNTVQPGDVDPVRQLSLGNVQIDECLRRGAAAFEWAAKRGRRRDAGPLRRGVGVACGGHTNSMLSGFADFSSMTLRLNDDGTFLLNTAVHDMGCGTLTSMQQIVAEVLDVSPEAVTVLEADTQRSPYDFGTYASRVTYICGACAHKVAGQVRAQILDVAAHALAAYLDDLMIADGHVRVRGGGRTGLDFKTIARVALLGHNTEIIATATHSGTTNPGSYGAHFAGVEVDTLTGLVRVTDYTAAHDVGRAINPGMVEGQVQGAVQTGIGYALTEEIHLDGAGNLKMEGFKDYHLVNAPDMPDVQVVIVEGGGDEGPFGAKSVGEISLVPVAGAVVNAVNHALGTWLTDLPLTPEKVLAGLEEMGSG